MRPRTRPRYARPASMARLYPASDGWSGMSNARARSGETTRSDAGAAPAVGGPGGADQHVAQFAQFGCPGSFVERRGDVLGGASHLVDAIRQVGGVVGRQHHRVGGQSRRPRPGSSRPAARRPAAGTTAGSTGGDGPSRRRSRPDRTNGTAEGGHDGSRLPTLVGLRPRSRYHGGRVAHPACRPGNYADRRNVCYTDRIALPEPRSSRRTQRSSTHG